MVVAFVVDIFSVVIFVVFDVIYDVIDTHVSDASV